MDITFKPVHLLCNELNYELRIRNVISNRDQDDKRKILRRLLERERATVDLNSLIDPNFNYDNECMEVNQALESIKSLIGEFEGPTSDSLFKRLKSRLAHITCRVQRMPIEDGNHLQLEFKNESYASCLQLEADLHEKVDVVQPLSVTDNTDNRVFHQCNASQAPVNNSKSIPVYKLGLQFDGDPNKLLPFIERIEELAHARRISKLDLYEASSDLFTDKATFWLRQIKSEINDWDSLVLRLKRDFLNSDFDDEIWEQIRVRGQGKTERVVIFIACMEVLFSRLSRSVPEVTKVKYMTKGLLSEYRRSLALSEVHSVAELSNLCRKLEMSNVSNSNVGNFVSRQCSTLFDPELTHIPNSSLTSSDVPVPLGNR